MIVFQKNILDLTIDPLFVAWKLG